MFTLYVYDEVGQRYVLHIGCVEGMRTVRERLELRGFMVEVVDGFDPRSEHEKQKAEAFMKQIFTH